jgi:glycerate 2-kinase
MPIDTSHLMTASLRNLSWGDKVARVMAAALAAADPEEAVLRHMTREGERLEIAGRLYELDRFRRILVVGAGKAGAPMLKAVIHLLGDRIDSGVIIVKEGHTLPDQAYPPGLKILQAGHPVPDERGLVGTLKIIDLLKEASEDDLVICLISGGGSALLTAPVPEITLQDMQALTSALLASGADIHEINTLRKHLDMVKGGGMARLAYPAQFAALILSDVVGDPLDVIASGPTVPDSSSFSSAWEVLERYGLSSKVDDHILDRLKKGRAGDIPETPKPGDPILRNIQNVIVGSNRQAVEAGLQQAAEEGFQPILLTTRLTGEARRAGRTLAALTRLAVLTGGQPLCMAAGGETTVVLKGNGLGGRNQELALSAVEGLSGLPSTILASLATDGGDGPTDAAGAIATGETFVRSNSHGMHPDSYLDRNDAYHFFESLDDLLKPGATLTNVNDITFIFINPH